jgi:hypothetical protein
MNSFRMRPVALAFVALTLAGCPGKSGDSKDNAGESSSAEAKKKRKAKKRKKRGSGVEAPTGDRLPIAVGQWTRHKVKTSAGKGTMTYSITKEEAGAHWLHFEYKVGTTSMTFDALIDFGDLKDFRKADIKKAKIKLPNGGEQLIQGPMLNQMKTRFGNALGTLAGVHDEKSPREDVTVPAGTFEGCYKAEEKVTAFGTTSESTSWRHTAVPLTTMVKMVTKKGDTWELEGYGLKGGPPN